MFAGLNPVFKAEQKDWEIDWKISCEIIQGKQFHSSFRAAI